MKPPDSTCKIIETLNFFSSSLGYGCRNDFTVLNKFDKNRVSILSFKKHASSDRIFTLTLVYRNQSIHMQDFFQIL